MPEHTTKHGQRLDVKQRCVVVQARFKGKDGNVLFKITLNTFLYSYMAL